MISLPSLTCVRSKYEILLQETFTAVNNLLESLEYKDYHLVVNCHIQLFKITTKYSVFFSENSVLIQVKNNGNDRFSLYFLSWDVDVH